MSVKTLFSGGSSYADDKRDKQAANLIRKDKLRPLRRKENVPAKFHRDGDGTVST